MSQVVLVSSDQQSFVVDLEVAEMSTAIKTMIEHLGEDSDMEPIPILNVRGEILSMVLQWAEHHRHDHLVTDSDTDNQNQEETGDTISQWDQAFLLVDQGTLFDVILAANYLDIKDLLDIACKTVANKIKGKNPEEIREVLNIRNDYSPAEEELIRRHSAGN